MDLNNVWNYNYNSEISMHSYDMQVKRLVDDMDYSTQGFFKATRSAAVESLNILQDVLRSVAGLGTVELAHLSRNTGIIILDKESELLCQLVLDIGNTTVTQYDDDYLLDDTFSFESPIPTMSPYIEDYL